MAIRGLENLIDIGYTKVDEKGQTMLALETSIFPYNIDEIYDIWKYCRKNNIFPLIDTVLYEGSAKNQDFNEFLVDYDKIICEVQKINEFDKKLGLDWKVKVVKRENNKGVIIGELAGDCHRIGTNLNVNSEGDVYDCFNMSQRTYGNIRNRSLITIWNEDKPYKNALCVHGLCQCRDFINRDSVLEELNEAIK
ncbi:SPASM domain-containing protein [Clostridium sp. ZS2-4]|uniref:SPASM domain-containing protein n=1 Tax=Clostridium sp. ZS2-4 TaxID=2987703 RepID=UPI00227CE162|nr:SPASM domain-containing protein [Clostridium sp. ZS2-4]MCY6355326.1 SPASM domain-containing protein [Clostridium sp. ZS2-4]